MDDFECSICGGMFCKEAGFEDENGIFVCKICTLGAEAAAIVTSEGTKYDNKKLRFDLIPPEVLTLDAAVYTMGAEKYEDNNWRKGIKYSRVIGALMRHLVARICGEIIDPESGLPHLAHVRWNVGALMYFDLYPDKYQKYQDSTPDELNNLILGLLHEDYPWGYKGKGHGGFQNGINER